MIFNDYIINKLKKINKETTRYELASIIIKRTTLNDLLKKFIQLAIKRDFEALSIIAEPAINIYSQSSDEELEEAFLNCLKTLITKIPVPYRESIILNGYRKLGGDVGEFCYEVLLKEKLTESEKTTIEIHFHEMADINVNDVINCINKYCRNGQEPPKKVKEFFDWLLKKLKIYGLETLIGPWARQNYYLNLIRTNRIKKNIIIYGETGCGKSFIAPIIHDNSGRLGKYVVINTKLDEKRFLKKIKDAENGTLFLDEVDLRISKNLQYKIFNDLPSEGIISASGRIPFSKLKDRKLIERFFIKDFYRRIKGPEFKILPLKDKYRRDDCKEAIKYFWRKKTTITEIDEEVVSELSEKYDWPLNIDQVQQIIVDIYTTKVNRNGDEKKLTPSNLYLHWRDLPGDTKEIIKKVFSFS